MRFAALLLGLLLFSACRADAQTPRISALLPAGARAGDMVDVAVKGGGLVGARSVLITGAPGVAAELTGEAAQVDEGARPLFQSKCTTCHEPRSPANRSLSPEQWASTVDRMISARGAEINAPDKTRIVGYLQALAKAGQMRVRVRVAPNAAPGLRELRVVTGQGVSTAYSFEVGTVPEIASSSGNDTPLAAQKVALPAVINGVLTKSGEKQFFSFDARKNQRLGFSLKAFRLNEQCAAYFNPALYLFDATGREVAKNLGRFGVDPVIDWTAPADGTYTLLVRDLIWKGSPSSVYRLYLGNGAAEGVLSPAAAAPGSRLSARLMPVGSDGSNPASSDFFAVQVPDGARGVTMVATPQGEAALLVRDLPDGGEPTADAAPAVALPAVFRGCINRAGETNIFRVHAQHGGGSLQVYARRLGSPLHPRVEVKNDKGRTVASRLSAGDSDLRVPNAFPAPGDYTVEVSDADGGGGPGFMYCWESRDGAPDFQLSVSPDVVNLIPGASTVLTVKAVRRENLRGPVLLTVRGLPPGVTTAGDAVLLPNMETAVVTITAAPGAAVAASAIYVEGRTTEAGGDGAKDAFASVTRVAVPVEIYRVNNNAHTLPRGTAVVAVTADAVPPFTLTVSGSSAGSISLSPGGEVKITVQVNRAADFKGEVQLMAMGLPPGVSAAQPVVSVKGGQSQATLTLRASNEARSLKGGKNGTVPPVRFVIGGYVGGGGTGSFDVAPNSTTAPLTLVSH